MALNNDGSPMDLTSEPVQTIKIDANDRYVFLISAPKNMLPEELHRMGERAQEHLERWEKNGNQFLIFTLYDDISVRFERLENGSKD